MTDQPAARNGAITSDERIRNALRRHIRRALDTHAFTRASLEKESKVSIHTIDHILTNDPAKHRRVAAEDALCLAYVLGDDAVAALVGCIHYTASRPDDGRAAAPGRIVAAGIAAFSTIANAAADGRIDHTERPACRDAADMIIATVLPLSSAGDAE
jgi:hypothetical protein